jgi:pimeloyl-ACP methyl ester carboxylesterase
MSETVQRDVTASGVRLRVSQHGTGPAVLMLHGAFVDHTTWEGVTHALRDDFTLIAPDFPGFGESEKPPPQRFPYGIDTSTEAIADLYAGLDLGRSAVVGHGLGGAVALTLAARHPELVSELVLVDTLCYQTARDLKQRVVLVPLFGGLLFKQLLGRTMFRALFRDTMLSQSGAVAPERLDHYYDMLNTPAARGSALATLRAAVDTRPIVAQIPRIQTPTLVLWGRHDKLYPAALGQRLAREIRGAGFELLDAGHCPQEECPAQLARVVARFLRAERPSFA